jgi:Transglutaminase-like superfamily
LSPPIEVWRTRARTVLALTLLLWAIVLVRLVPMRLWRDRLGLAQGRSDASEAGRWASQVERAGWRWPFASKCLPRAMALSWLLRRNRLAHRVVLAIRPQALRHSPDALHAWVEAGGERVLGDLPGQWFELHRLPQAR